MKQQYLLYYLIFSFTILGCFDSEADGTSHSSLTIGKFQGDSSYTDKSKIQLIEISKLEKKFLIYDPCNGNPLALEVEGNTGVLNFAMESIFIDSVSIVTSEKHFKLSGYEAECSDNANNRCKVNISVTHVAENPNLFVTEISYAGLQFKVLMTNEPSKFPVLKNECPDRILPEIDLDKIDFKEFEK